MQLLISLFFISLHRAICSIRFVASVCCVTFVLFLTSFGMITPLSDVLSVLFLKGSGNMILIVGIIPLIPFATSFASEWEERAAGFWIIRSGVRNYAAAKIMVSAISGTLATFTGILLYALLLLTKLPFFVRITIGDAYSPLLDDGMSVQYFLYSAAHLSLSSALFAVAALWVSTFIPNIFTAIAAPTVLYFVLLRMTTFWDVPSFLNIGTIVEGTYDAGSPIMTMLFKLGTVMMLCLLMGLGTIVQIRRRVQYV